MISAPRFSLIRSSIILIFLLLIIACQAQKEKLNAIEYSLVYVHPAIEDKYSSKGSGFIIAKNNDLTESTFYVLTANHLVGMLDSSKIVVTTHVDKKTHLVRYIKKFEDIDLAILEVEGGEQYNIVNLSEDASNKKSSIHVFGMANCNFRETIINKVSYKSIQLDGSMMDIGDLLKSKYYKDLRSDDKQKVSKSDLYYAVSIANGMSGSPVINDEGKVIGVQLSTVNKPLDSCEQISSEAKNSLGVSIRKFLQRDIPIKIRSNLVIDKASRRETKPISPSDEKIPSFIRASS
jgi:S1-C subfamily serine protease